MFEASKFANIQKVHQTNVVSLFQKWKDCDDSIYDKTMKTKYRLFLSRKGRTSAFQVSWWIYAAGQEGMDATVDGSASHRAAKNLRDRASQKYFTRPLTDIRSIEEYFVPAF